MELARLGRKGQLTIPRAALDRAGWAPEVPLSVETLPDGAIVLRPVAVLPVEMYSDERIAGFERTTAIPDDLYAAARKLARRPARRR
ncbi:MAG: AbrB/MazE/SpoVT family DNA-binding domain-containing protein [Betaproteobacteria bacterium]